MTSTTSLPSDRQSFMTGRGSLYLAGILALFTAYIGYGILTMDVPDSAQSPGPKFYPTLLVVATTAIIIGLVVNAIRNPDIEEGDTRYVPPVGENRDEAMIQASGRPDTRNLIIAIVSFLVFALVLEPVGWVISAALLFWALTLTFNAKKPLIKLAVGLVVSCAIQVAFSMGLGLALPAGILGGLF
ncbi:tripartite tricarboxylate transporter TctB family protein [Corynebacterium glyciniphilum]|uniref:tripartite tricarboxylate transporter TctB family protein n=1 Tax=Corynebacterium glyciniphilum TaxID=1404244 RepID=UPI0023546EC1